MTSEAGSEVRFEFDRDVLGVDVELGSITLTPKLIADYCAAVVETNPLYTNEADARSGPYGGLIAPAGMLPSLTFGRGGLDPKVNFGNTQMFAGSRLETFAPARPGDTITAKVQVKEVFPKTGRSGTMLFIVRRTSYYNQDGTLVAASEQSIVHREV
ncbi:MAG: MaoC family dehydratase N-terminal domain-containing protein [Chloroflexi bacterium]|nr:MaoC family dehydratase N-terminal domain-containing protein [Chloroflexota bacterium]MDA1004068.1 MaoC family dehydratase N-terminal domain-containing protein [Chloroflexota bacterium]